MTDRAARLFDRLEAHRVAFTARLDALPDAVVHRSPGDGAWSLAEIADHLVRVDETIRPDGRPATTSERVTSRPRGVAIQGILALPVRYPVPPGADRVRPGDGVRWPEIRERWDAVRARWKALDPAADIVASRHPIVGRLVWADALVFLLAHHRHHEAQVERTLAAVDG